ncbi:MAG: hypothetical protein ACFFE8_15810, partial [Candidatus Heimdallarchaeota archaeon]
MRKEKILLIWILILVFGAVLPSNGVMNETTLQDGPYAVDRLTSTVSTVSTRDEGASSSRMVTKSDLSNETSLASTGGSNKTLTAKMADPIQANGDSPGWIVDPTGHTAGYNLSDYSDTYFELRGSRGQFSRHFYNKTSGKYTYQSDALVQKTGVFEDTIWVTEDEYPHRFMLRLRGGETYLFETAGDITTFLKTVDRSSIWSVGFESFAGVMGFYLNALDTRSGHGQYLYWPRLSDGSINGLDQPLYAIYPHLFAKSNGQWMDQILTDRSLYSGKLQSLQDTLTFYDSSTEFGVFFSLMNTGIQGTNWNFKHGFKYRMSDQSYHMITEIECLSHDFDDIGLAYDLTTAPQNENSAYSPNHFVLTSEEEEVVISAEETWQAKNYLTDFWSQVNLVTENGEQFHFVFDDMALTGFSEKYLQWTNLQLPDNTVKKVLRAGMYGFGTYRAGTTVEIDPFPVYSTDNYDLYRKWTTWYTGYTYMIVGSQASTLHSMYLAFNTGLDFDVWDITSVSLQLYCETSTFDDSSEGASCYVYNVGGNADSNTAKENSLSYATGTNAFESKVYSGNIGSGGYKTADQTKMGNLLNFWADNRNSNENWISFRFSPSGPESEDYYKFRDSQYSGTSRDPKLSFLYHPTDYTIGGLVHHDGNGIQGAYVQLFHNGAKIGEDVTSSSGAYSIGVTEDNHDYTLWAWHEDYISQSETVRPTEDLIVNFNLVAVNIPTQNPPFGVRSPTAFTEDDTTAWKQETQAYALGTDYAVSEKADKNIYYKSYGWQVPSTVTIQGVYVYVHWKSVLDDRLSVKLYWNGGASSPSTLSTSAWAFTVLNYTSVTSWTAAKINSDQFRVSLKQVEYGVTQDKLIVDWVGTLVEYADVRAFTCYTLNGTKGENYSFNILFHNYGTVAAAHFDFKVKLENFNYTDYDTWINNTYAGTSLNADSSVWVNNIIINRTFEGTA